MSGQIRDTLITLSKGQDLSFAEISVFVNRMLSGELSEPIIASFLTALRVKGETAEELAGTVATVRSRIEKPGLEISTENAIDTCGTGGDGANTLNVSTAAAIVVASAGVPVAKHGNRSASGNSGSAEVLTELGINVEASNTSVTQSFQELGIAFLFAPRFHPGLRFAGPVRKQLPFRTLFNLVGPLANPANPRFQLVGVAGEAQANLVAGALAKLGIHRAAVVTGFSGLDEISLEGPTRVQLVENGQIETREWTPGDFGFEPFPTALLRVSGPLESAQRIRRLLQGTPGPDRNIVVANAAGALWTTGTFDLKTAVERASEAIDSGASAELLERWRQIQN